MSRTPALLAAEMINPFSSLCGIWERASSNFSSCFLAVVLSWISAFAMCVKVPWIWICGYFFNFSRKPSTSSGCVPIRFIPVSIGSHTSSIFPWPSAASSKGSSSTVSSTGTIKSYFTAVSASSGSGSPNVKTGQVNPSFLSATPSSTLATAAELYPSSRAMRIVSEAP